MSQPCQNGGTCYKSSYGYQCLCTKGYYGKNCQKGICFAAGYEVQIADLECLGETVTAI
ncbi:EGF-like domain protein [Trichuris suis]|nr:EGF-like domain protein [Trichuris suis]